MHLSPFRAFSAIEESPASDTVCRAALARSFGDALACVRPYPHWMMADLLPPGLVRALVHLPYAWPASPAWGCVRPKPQAFWPVSARDQQDSGACRTVAQSFQATETLASIAHATGTDLRDCSLSLRLLREVDGYACAPQTRCGEARFTLLVALDTGGQSNLGPDIYSETGEWAGQPPWRPGCAVGFAPSPRSWHGFEPRMIRGVRSSLLVDYVRSNQAPEAASR
jgi:hypothetical protein